MLSQRCNIAKVEKKGKTPIQILEKKKQQKCRATAHTQISLGHCEVNPICSKRLKSFTASISGMESLFFPCQFNPIAFDILARDWLLFYFVYAAGCC